MSGFFKCAKCLQLFTPTFPTDAVCPACSVVRPMTIEEAEKKALEWRATHEGANAEEECECHGAAERLRNEARSIEKEIESAGYDACDLIRAIERRRRAR